MIRVIKYYLLCLVLANSLFKKTFSLGWGGGRGKEKNDDKILFFMFITEH